ncbi:hypothetical protein [Klebsiella aerogenes]|uniref:hypothetical protein n=1 Tax=Klebsiella aerogenes TaxID=548 RepID=UPI0013967159|nr:hypothetical protein [Klebsiella aerogenes]
MTPSAGALPTYKNSSLVLPAVVTGFNGLSTEYHDSNSMTLAAVIQYTGAATQILLGVNTGTQGECIFFDMSDFLKCTSQRFWFSRLLTN